MNFLQTVKFKINLRRVLRIAIWWALAGAADACLMYLAGNSNYFEATIRYNFQHHFIANTVAFFFTGLIAGYISVYFLRDRIRQLSFVQSLIVVNMVIGTTVVFLSYLLYGFFFSWVDDLPIYDERVWQQASLLFLSPLNIKNILFAFALAFMSILFLNINDRYGPGVLMDYLLGKYHRPRQEERIFMFVDMKSSTTIAEQLGDIAFHDLLNDYFKDLTDPILYTRGEVYQYVGDEVIVTWPTDKGLYNFNCVRCFFAMQEAISMHSTYYQNKYGLVPEFKAGLHCGQVTTGEIGIIKRDIVHSGDVLNTTARIQSKCNELNVKVLLSKVLLDKLGLPPHRMLQKELGEIDLRGKKEKIRLYTIEELTS